MRSAIAKSFNYSQKELPLRKATIEKKSKWMKLWRMYFFSYSVVK